MAGTFSLSGIGSGIDGKALAKAIGDRVRVPNTQYNNQIEDNKSESSSLERLRELLLNVSSKLDGQRTANGGAGGLSAGSSDSKIVAASADSSAQAGNFTVNVQTLATTASGSFNRSFSSGSEFISQSPEATGSVQFSVGSGETSSSFSVNVSETTTAQDFVSEFNSKAGGKASARLVNTGTESAPNYRISFSTANVGTEKGSLSANSASSDLLGDSGLGGTTLTQATDAQFSVSGIAGTFTRASNTVSDVVSGVSLQLAGTGQATVSVQPSASTAANQLEGFISAFNDLAKFTAKEDQVTSTQEDGESRNIYGSLARTEIDDQAVEALRSAVSSARGAESGYSLASLGVSTNRDGTLSFDREKFEEAFAADPTAVTDTITNLADQVSGVEGAVYQSTGYGLAIDQGLKANESENEALNRTIAGIERRASSTEEGTLQQFSKLEGLFAKLQADSGFIQSLLQF